MKNIYTFIFGLVGLLLMTMLAIGATLAPSLNPVFAGWVAVFGLFMAGELVLIGIGRKQ